MLPGGFTDDRDTIATAEFPPEFDARFGIHIVKVAAAAAWTVFHAPRKASFDVAQGFFPDLHFTFQFHAVGIKLVVLVVVLHHGNIAKRRSLGFGNRKSGHAENELLVAGVNGE